MYHYGCEQKTLEINGVRIGGRPGLVPTVMIGSIFYSKDKLVTDAERGTIDKAAVESALNELQVISDRTALPNMLDVVASTPEAMAGHLTSLVDMTRMPLLIDGSGSAEVNLAGIKTAKDGGFIDRVVLNALTPESSDKFIVSASELGLRNAVALAFSSDAMTSAARRVELAGPLLQKSVTAGIANVLFDTGVVDMLTLGLACKALMQLKDTYGYPVGCGAHNAVNMWTNLVPRFGVDAKKPALAGASLLPVAMGADFVLYGPIKYAQVVFPVVAMADIALSGAFLEERIRPPKPHPRYVAG